MDEMSDIEVKIKQHSEDEISLVIAGKEIRSSGSRSSARTAFLFDKFVVKMGCNNACEQEIDFWEKYVEEADKKYFAAILGYGTYRGDTFIIQERVFPTDSEMSKEQEGIFNSLCNKYAIGDVDSDGHNVCINVDGTFKIFDFETAEEAWKY